MVVSALVGIGGLLVGVKGQRLAKQADGRAQAALIAAEEANGIARAANEISKEANAIARVAAGEQGEDWHVDFDVDWDAYLGGIVVRNSGRDAANQVSLIVAGEHLHHTDVIDVVEPGQIAIVKMPQIAKMRLESIKVQQATFDSLLEVGVFGMPPQFELRADVTLVCASPLGRVRRQQEKVSIT